MSAEGDLESVYREHGARLWRAVAAFAGDREVASDAVAEAFAQAIRRGDAVRDPLRWVWRVAFRIAAGELRERGRFGPAAPDASAPEPDAPSAALITALRKLSPKQRAAVILHHYAGYPVKEVAGIIGSTTAAVKSISCGAGTGSGSYWRTTMRDLDERLRALDRLDPPELWADIRTRNPRPEPEPGGRGRVGVVAAAVLVAALGIGLAVRAFVGGPGKELVRPAHLSSRSTNGEIWARIGGGDGPSFVYSIQPDGSGQTLLFSDGRDPNSPPGTVNRDAIGEDYAWSPEGSKVAFLNYSGYDDVQGEHTAVFLMNPDGTGRVQLTGDGELDSGPSWSPDGTRVAYASDREGPYPYVVGCWASKLCPSDIYVVSSDGAGDVRLTDDPADDSEPSWSPDGTRIAFKSTRDDPSGDIYVMNADGTEVTRLTSDPGWESNPQWSPDGTRIAFTGFQHGGGVDVYVMDADGSNVTRLTDYHDNSFVQDLEWSPDGTKIAFTTDPAGTLALYVMNTDGSRIQKLADGASSLAWRPAPV